MKLFGEIVGTFDGPIIVIGGGPSAPADLAVLQFLIESGKLQKPVAVLSANEHGHKQDFLEVTHSVCCDGNHGEKRVPMERLLGAYGKPIIGPAHFCDYRLPEWSLAANTGLTAVCVAVFMGGHPVIVTGIDFYRLHDKDAAVYFHDPQASSNSTSKQRRNFESQVDALEQWVGARAPIRSMQGPLLGHFKQFVALEHVPAVPLAPRAKYLRSLPKLIVQCRPFPTVSFKLMNVEPGRIFPVSPNEAKGPINSHKVKLIETHPAPDGSELRLPLELVRPPRGYRPSPKPRAINRPR